jgi:hypothetical protein
MYPDPMGVVERLCYITGFHLREARRAGDEKTCEQILRELSLTPNSFIRLIEVLILIPSGQQVRPLFSLPDRIANRTISSRIFESWQRDFHLLVLGFWLEAFLLKVFPS